MAKVRVHADVVSGEHGSYKVVRTDGIRSDAVYFNREDAQRHADYINNEDSDYPEYRIVPDYEEIEREERRRQREREREREKREKREKRSAEIAEYKKQVNENNRNNKKTDKKYVFVVACYIRGGSYTQYLTGNTNLLKSGNFITRKEKDAKIFKTKASAQKYIDTVTNNWIVLEVFRDFRVVRKAKDKIGLEN